jgi:hypothetical protein
MIGVIDMAAPWNTQHQFQGFGWFTLFAYSCYLYYGYAAHRLLRRSNNTLKQVAVAVSGSTVFFIVTNFGSWLTLGIYPMSAQGLIECYVAALPFYGWQVFADVLFSTVWFSAHKGLTKLDRFASEKVICEVSHAPGEEASLLRGEPVKPNQLV